MRNYRACSCLGSSDSPLFPNRNAAYQHARDQVVAGISPVEILFPFGGIAALSEIGLSELPEPVQRE